eukprot:2113292-Pyramimonas_sp.AAC.3
MAMVLPLLHCAVIEQAAAPPGGGDASRAELHLRGVWHGGARAAAGLRELRRAAATPGLPGLLRTLRQSEHPPAALHRRGAAVTARCTTSCITSSSGLGAGRSRLVQCFGHCYLEGNCKHGGSEGGHNRRDRRTSDRVRERGAVRGGCGGGARAAPPVRALQDDVCGGHEHVHWWRRSGGCGS